MGYEMLIKIGKFKKIMNITNRSSGSLVNNGINLVRIHVNIIFRDDVVEEFHFGLMKFTFIQLGIKSNFPKLVQNKSNMLLMLF
jgi:hypothetical protein